MERSVIIKEAREINRRSLLKTIGLTTIGGALITVDAFAKTSGENDVNSGKDKEKLSPGKRQLGKSLEVSGIGIGVQNMSRTYQTIIPTRSGADNVHFTTDELKQFNSELDDIRIEGARLPPFVEALSGVDAPAKT